MKAQTIQIFLPDGSPASFKEAELTNGLIKVILLLILALLPLDCISSEYDSPLEFFFEAFILGFIITSVVYLLLGSLMVYSNRNDKFEKYVIITPLSIVIFVLVIMFVLEAMVHNSGGLLGGSIVGGIISSLIYFLIVNIIQIKKSKKNNYSFKTKYLDIVESKNHINSLKDTDDFYEAVVNIMSPDVTKYLPNEWKRIYSIQKAKIWIKKINTECCFYLIKQSELIIGFIFIYEEPTEDHCLNIRLGYLLSKQSWGKGYASELIQGLLIHCKSISKIRIILAGVSNENEVSIHVLEKCGFTAVASHNKENLIYEYVYSLKRA